MLLQQGQQLRRQIDTSIETTDVSSSHLNETPDDKPEDSSGEYDFTPTWEDIEQEMIIQKEIASQKSPNQDRTEPIHVDKSTSEDARKGHNDTINEEDVSFHPRNSATLSTTQNKSGDSTNDDTLETEVSDNVNESIPKEIQDRTRSLHQRANAALQEFHQTDEMSRTASYIARKEQEMLDRIEKREREMLENIEAHNSISISEHEERINELNSLSRGIEVQANSLSDQMVDFAHQKEKFKQEATQIFDEKAVALETRISKATEIFDQKVKDKMIDFERIQNEIKQTYQDIQVSVTTNEVNLESFKDSIDTGDDVHEKLLQAIQQASPICAEFKQQLDDIKSAKASFLKQMSGTPQPSGNQQTSFKDSLADHEKKIQDIVNKGFQQLMLMSEHYLASSKEKFQTYKKKTIDQKITEAKRMYEDLDNKLDEVSIAVVKIDKAVAAKIQDVTSSAKFHTKIEIQVRNDISEFMENNPEDIQKEIRKYIQEQSPEQNALFNYVSDMVDDQIDEYIEKDESNKLKLFCQRVSKPYDCNHPKSDDSKKPASQFEATRAFLDEHDGFDLDGDDLDDDKKKKPKCKYRLEQDTAFNKILSNIGQMSMGTRLPTSGLPTSQVMQNIYAEVYNIWQHNQLPLTKYDDLKKRKSTIPADFPSGNDGILGVISTVLLTILSNNLPSKNKLLQDIFEPYRPDSD